VDAITADPDLLVRWGLGEDVLPSGIVKGANDWVFACMEKGGNYLISIGDDAVPHLDYIIETDSDNYNYSLVSLGTHNYTIDWGDGTVTSGNCSEIEADSIGGDTIGGGGTATGEAFIPSDDVSFDELPIDIGSTEAGGGRITICEDDVFFHRYNTPEEYIVKLKVCNDLACSEKTLGVEVEGNSTSAGLE
jgi:hypothetical protein